MDLIALQNSTRKITNPLSVDFIAHWGGVPYRIPAKTTWSLIGPLADHVARHLYMKIRYAYHDEQVAKIKQQPNGIQAARKYSVPVVVEDAIFYMINGFHRPEAEEKMKAEQEAVDLSFIAESIHDVDSHAAATGGEYRSISDLVDAATAQTYKQIDNVSDPEQTAHASGTVNTVQNIAKIMQQTQDPVTQVLEAQRLAKEIEADKIASTAPAVPVPDPASPAASPETGPVEVTNPTGGEFGDLAKLS